VPPVIRRAQILEQIQRDGGVSIAELARAHGVSPVTVHRDLEQLASEGRLTVHEMGESECGRAACLTNQVAGIP